jgi:hypothetical protein
MHAETPHPSQPAGRPDSRRKAMPPAPKGVRVLAVSDTLAGDPSEGDVPPSRALRQRPSRPAVVLGACLLVIGAFMTAVWLLRIRLGP